MRNVVSLPSTSNGCASYRPRCVVSVIALVGVWCLSTATVLADELQVDEVFGDPVTLDLEQ